MNISVLFVFWASSYSSKSTKSFESLYVLWLHRLMFTFERCGLTTWSLLIVWLIPKINTENTIHLVLWLWLHYNYDTYRNRSQNIFSKNWVWITLPTNHFELVVIISGTYILLAFVVFNSYHQALQHLQLYFAVIHIVISCGFLYEQANMSWGWQTQ